MRTKIKVLWLLIISCALLAVFSALINGITAYFNIPIVKYMVPIQAALPYVLTIMIMAISTKRSTFIIESPKPSVTKFNPPMLLTGAVMIAAANFVAQPIELYIPNLALSLAPPIANNFSTNGAYAMGTFVILMPICQGWFFRGLLQNNIRRIFPSWAAISLSATIYLAFHLSINQSFTILVTHVIFGLIYNKYRSLSTVIGVHILFNGMTYLTVLLTGNKDPIMSFIDSVSTEMAILIWTGAIIALIIGYGILSKKLVQNTGK